jgi:hypothetical protein
MENILLLCPVVSRTTYDASISRAVRFGDQQTLPTESQVQKQLEGQCIEGIPKRHYRGYQAHQR